MALLGTSDVLKAVLGEKPEAALGLIVVASAIAAAVVGIGPLILKAIGPDPGVPTVGGTVVAGVVTAFGTFGQIAAVTIQACRLTSSFFPKSIILGGGLATSVLVGFYGVRALRGFIDEGQKRSSSPAEVRAAWVVAKALRPHRTRVQLTPLDIEELLAEEPRYPVAASGTARAAGRARGPDRLRPVATAGRSALL